MTFLFALALLAADAGTKLTHCKLLDDAGAVVVEHDSAGTTVRCQGEIREKVKARRCAPGKKLQLQYVSEPGKPIAMTITCPKE